MRRTTLVIGFLLVVASCGGDSDVVVVDSETSESSSIVSDPTDAPSNGDTASAGTIEWEECGPVECGTLEVPLDYDDPNSGTISIHLERRVANDPDKRIGSLLMNPGGPGFGGSILARAADQILSKGLLDHFDIVGFDPRGTGESEPAIDCTDDYDYYFAQGDVTPDDATEAQFNIDLTKEFIDDCLANNSEFIDHVGTNNVARDMDLIRQALGEDKISYFGLSYGSELGAVWATLFPDTVRAAVLDGAADPNVDSVEASVQQKRGFEQALTAFLADCSATRSCKFHNDGDAEGAFDRLMAELDENPLPTEDGRPDLTRGMASTSVAQALYDESYWDTLAAGLAEAADGNGSILLALFDAYFQRQPDGSYGNELEAFIAITCADEDERFTIEEADSFVPRYREAAPRMSPETQGNYGCTFWPAATDPRVDVTGRGAGPIVVIGTTGDPSTPLDSTRNMVKALEDGRLVVVTANQHTGYTASKCARDVVDDYLIELKAPTTNVDC
jgi:pimeloyl-ACP methyl ester carboxylesterase